MEAYSWQKMLIAEHFKNPQLKKEVFKNTVYSHAQKSNQTENMQENAHYLSQRSHEIQ